MIEMKKIFNYSESGNKAIELSEKIAPLMWEMDRLKVEIANLEADKQLILEDLEIKAGKKALPINWSEINRLIREKNSEYKQLVEKVNPLIQEHGKFLDVHNQQREILHYLDEETEYKN